MLLFVVVVCCVAVRWYWLVFIGVVFVFDRCLFCVVDRCCFGVGCGLSFFVACCFLFVA